MKSEEIEDFALNLPKTVKTTIIETNLTNDTSWEFQEDGRQTYFTATKIIDNYEIEQILNFRWNNVSRHLTTTIQTNLQFTKPIKFESKIPP